ncbi:MAG: DEAD/DEAH box helicase [Gammaproteobacteria bacterium]|nr:DEAD/DEAH box helicase [Gammaproteobacteria bacterium]
MIIFTEADIRQTIPAASYKRGYHYWLQDQIFGLEVEPLNNGKDLIRAEIRETKSSHHTLTVTVSRDARKKIQFDGECTCPVGYHCKHVAAALIGVLKAGKDLRPKRSASVTPVFKANAENLAKPEQPLSQASASAASAAPKLDTVEPAIRRWLERLAQAAAEADPNDGANDTKQRLLYLLNVKQQPDGSVLQVELVSTRVLKSGGYGAAMPFKEGRANYIRPVDKSLIQWLEKRRDTHQAPGTGYSIQGSEASEMLKRMLATGRCHWQLPKNAALSLGATHPAKPTWQIAPDGVQRLVFVVEGNVHAHAILPLIPLWYVDAKQALCGPLEAGLTDGLASALLEAPPLKPADANAVRARLAEQVQGMPMPQGFDQIRHKQVEPVVHLFLFNYIFQTDQRFLWRQDEKEVKLPLVCLSFHYGEVQVNAYGTPERNLSYFNKKTNELIQIKRREQIERRARQHMKNLGFLPLAECLIGHKIIVPEEHSYDLFLGGSTSAGPLDAEQTLLDFSLHEIPKLREAGWQVEVMQDYLYRVLDPNVIDEWYAQINEVASDEVVSDKNHRSESSGTDWFGLELGISVAKERIELLPLLVKLLKEMSGTDEMTRLMELPDETMLSARLEDGRILPLPAGQVRGILGALIELLDKDPLDESGRLRMSALRAAQLAELDATMTPVKMHWRGGKDLLEMGKKLKSFESIKEAAIPADFQTRLRPYQQDGLNWLQFLREYGLAGILADDMGLGKTVQTLAHILIEKTEGRLTQPCLVIAPTSLMGNWRQEAKRFAPALNVLTLHGPGRKDYFERVEDYDLVLTTYALLSRDKESMIGHNFHLLVLDEAQNIKNPKAVVTQVVHQIKARCRLCLTGTPMENHLGELWSLFHFLMPGLLGDSTQFRHLFRTPIEKDGDTVRRDVLSRRIAPFLLRRTKKEVLADLPEKTEIIRSVELEGGQRDLYETIRLAMHEKVRQEISEKGMARSHIVILDALLKLRQVCCDPRLLNLDTAKNTAQSAKLDLFLDLVPEMVEEGRRILVFSQFTSMLSLIEDALNARLLDFVKLTGQTTERTEAVERFQAGEIPIFLISLKAGGTGLNLTAADTVIHYDPWWNPAVETQATDRAHRIGQDKGVFVYKLLSTGTVEEKIQEMQVRKQHLTDALLSGKEEAASQLSQDDLEVLFEPLPQ